MPPRFLSLYGGTVTIIHNGSSPSSSSTSLLYILYNLLASEREWGELSLHICSFKLKWHIWAPIYLFLLHLFLENIHYNFKSSKCLLSSLHLPWYLLILFIFYMVIYKSSLFSLLLININFLSMWFSKKQRYMDKLITKQMLVLIFLHVLICLWKIHIFHCLQTIIVTLEWNRGFVINEVIFAIEKEGNCIWGRLLYTCIIQRIVLGML